MPDEAERPIRTVQIGGLRAQVEGPSADDRYFQTIGDHFEPEFEKLCEHLIREDYICVDIGANIGMKSLMLAQAASRGKVLAIEAAPTIFPILERNIRRSGLKNIISKQAAVTDRDGKVFFKDNSAYGHISDSGVEVRAATLETLLREAELQKPDFVKIDVEGFEFPILRSSLELFDESSSVIVFELNIWTQLVMGRTNPVDLIKWVSEHFAEVHVLHKNPERGFLLEKVRPERCLEILRTALLNGWVVSDLVVTNAPERLWPAARELVTQLPQRAHAGDCAIAERDLAIAERDIAITERDTAVADRERAIAERDRAVTEKDRALSERDAAASRREAIINSKSWALTAPLRALMTAIRGR